MSAAAASTSSTVRAAQATAAPAAPSARPMARPMPRPAPVTSATRPASENAGSTVSALTTARAGDPLGHELAHAVPLDLPAGRHGELRDDLDALGKLVARQLMGVEERHDLGERDRLAVARDHDRARALPEARIGHAHDGHAGDLGMRVEQVLHLDDRDVLAAADDQVLGAPGDGEVAVAVERAPVARLEPAVRRVALEGELWPLEVADELGRPADEQVALGPGGDVMAVEPHQAQLHAGQRRAVGGEDLLLRVLQAVARHQAVLGHPPAGRDGAAEARLSVAGRLPRYRRFAYPELLRSRAAGIGRRESVT